MRGIIIALIIIGSTWAWAQPGNNTGLLELKKEKTYWDRDSTKLRSEGYLQATGFGGVGDKFGKWKYYYENGQMEEIAHYYEGKYNGSVRQFYNNGKLKMEGTFFLGIPDGEFKAFYKNGKLAEEGMYHSIADSIRDTTTKYWDVIEYLPAIKLGDWKTYYEDGKPWAVYSYKPNDSLEYLMQYYNKEGKKLVSDGKGKIEESYSSGKPKLLTSYEDGLLTGPYKLWSANGKLKEEGAYYKGLRDGEWNFYHIVSGKLFQKIGYREGEKHGVFVEHLPNDSVSIEGGYADGKKDGLWTYYFENGQVDMTGHFKAGLQEGHWTYYYPNGQLYYEGDYSKGKKTGEWLFYYNNGQMWREGSYANDMKQGAWDFYYESGGDLMQGFFKDDLEHGAWVSYYENGQEKDRGSYENGQMTASWVGYYPNGEKSYEGNYERDMKTGTWLYYTSKGQLKDEGSYKILKTKEGESVGYNFVLVEEQSYKHGPWKSYSDIDGKIVSEGNYTRNRQTGTWKYYYPGGKVIAYENNYNSDGKLDGTTSNYSRKGKLVSEINYKDGKKHGDFKVYGKKGKLEVHYIYKNGVKVKDVIAKKSYKYGKE